MCSPEDPLFTPLLPLARVPFQAKESVHKTPFWENLEILASTASIFTHILAHKPPNLEVFQLTSTQIWKFSAHKSPFSEANVSSQAPYFGNPGRTPLPEKKLSAPPPPGPNYTNFWIFDKKKQFFFFKTIFDKALTPFWKIFLLLKQLFSASVGIEDWNLKRLKKLK